MYIYLGSRMSCIQCHTIWCYVCGLSEDKCDKGGYKTSMYDHYINWKKNPKRCPLWLNTVYQIDKRWPKDDNTDKEGIKAVLFFQSLIAKQALKEAYIKINKASKKDYKLLVKKYNIEEACGYDIHDILNGDHTIIKLYSIQTYKYIYKNINPYSQT